jgi:hypothetical protein
MMTVWLLFAEIKIEIRTLYIIPRAKVVTRDNIVAVTVTMASSALSR